MGTASFIKQASVQTVTYPMDIIAAKNWYITLPSKLHATPDTVKVGASPDLMSYSDQYFHLNAAKDGVGFKAPTDGATTTNSANPRSELREMTGDGKTQAAWSSTSGNHSMEIEQAVTVLPIGSKPVVVVGQIHDAADDVVVFRVEANRYGSNTGDKTLNSIWITDGNTTHGHLLTNSYKLGDRFRVGFQVSGGVIHFMFNGQPVDYSQKKNVQGCYFKAGCYNQSGGNVTKLPDGSADYAEVVIYAVQVCHDGVCTGNGPGTGPEPGVSPTAVITAGATNGSAPFTINFDGTQSTAPKGTITTYRWSFGDPGSPANTATTATTAHTYASAGTYTATLTVSDDKGATGSASIGVVVNDANNGDNNANAAYANLKIVDYTKPTDLKAKLTPGNGSDLVALSWKAAPGEAKATIVAYKIYEKAGSGSYVYILAVNDLKAAISKAVGSYRYKVSAVYKENNGGAFVESPTPSPVAVRVE